MEICEKMKDEQNKKKKIMGYTSGVFDMFHVGHLNILRRAKSLCDKLIVGVTTDELVGYKNTKALIPFAERCEIVQSVRYVDLTGDEGITTLKLMYIPSDELPEPDKYTHPSGEDIENVITITTAENLMGDFSVKACHLFDYTAECP